VAAAAAALALLTFLPSLRDGFIWDDHQTIEGPATRLEGGAFQLDHIGGLFSRSYFQTYKELSYRPVVTLSYFLDYALWKLDAVGYHATNLLLHALAAALAFAWCRRVTGHSGRSFVVAALFAVHPLQGEAVHNISFREDLLCTVFALAALLLYERGRDRQGGARWPLMAGSALCYAAAVLAKEAALLVVPGMILLRELLGRRKGCQLRRLLAWALPLFVVAGVYTVVRLGPMRFSGEQAVQRASGPLPDRLVQLPCLLLEYIRLLVWPVGLRAQRTAAVWRPTMLGWAVVLPLVAVAVLVLAKIGKRKQCSRWH